MIPDGLEGIDVDNPGYLRYCAFPLCPARFNIMTGPVAGWRMGRAGPIGTSYFCPDHAPIAVAHNPRWLREDGQATGTVCACGWTWVPSSEMPMIEHLLAWLLHLRPVATGEADAA